MEGLRPTADRVREQLFNWLQGELLGARCLDLFAGSGALGIEAASRGAEEVTLVDRHPAVTKQLERVTADLVQASDAVHFDCHCADALTFLRSGDASWHLVLLDPPFDTPVSALLLQAVDQRLHCRSWVYLEHRTGDALAAVPDRWQLHRSGKAGDASYALYRIDTTDSPG